MKKIKRTISISICCVFLLQAKAQETPVTKASFDNLNLSQPGLENVNKLVSSTRYDDAAKALLQYYRKKHISGSIDDDNQDKTSKGTQETADKALLHHFQPHKGYGFFDYGKDINWQYWPVKDNEVRWQLHRVKWWQAMGIAYRNSGNEKYAKEWVFQFRDWVKKNPLGLSKDNDKFAWRPLEISERLNNLRSVFTLFINSPEFTPQFLLEFLKSYDQQASYLIENYANTGNHRLFEAQRALGAGCFFPELKNAEKWRVSGISVLNAEIGKQVYLDGMQFELSPNYHIAMIATFLNGLRLAQQVGLEKEFPATYKNTIEKMIMATINFSFPDYVYPMFGDAKLVDKNSMLKQFQNWAPDFPQNPAIQYFATEGKKGNPPPYLSQALTTSGFYTFRNGWNDKATVMVLKASPPGAFHAQPDNGTFDLWVKGRNFTPDAGCYVYSGDAEITKLRDWYRQTRVHNTLTLDNKNMVITKAVQQKWETSKNLDQLTYTNPSYEKLNHQRSVLFIAKKYFIIIDRAIGDATGNLGVHYVLKEDSNPTANFKNNSIVTRYTDGNNLLIQCLNQKGVEMKEEEGKVSYQYRKEEKRPAYVFEKKKEDTKTQNFITIIYPFDGIKAPQISIKENADNNYDKGNISLSITIEGTKNEIKSTL